MTSGLPTRVVGRPYSQRMPGLLRRRFVPPGCRGIDLDTRLLQALDPFRGEGIASIQLQGAAVLRQCLVTLPELLVGRRQLDAQLRVERVLRNEPAVDRKICQSG